MYQQKLVRALVAFSRSVEAKLVTEGIETRDEGRSRNYWPMTSA